MKIKTNLLKWLFAVFIPLGLNAQLEIGTPAPELTLEGIYNRKGNEIPTLAALKGKIIVLDFWAVWCSPCVAAFPENNVLSNRYKDKNVQFIAITDDPAEKLGNFLKKVDIDFWVGRDDDQQDFKNYRIWGRPQMYIINRDGIIVYQGSHVTEDMIEEVIATNAVKQPEKAVRPEVIISGSFGPGEDPLYNGVGIMLGKSEMERPVLIDHFIIRPSYENRISGYGTAGPYNGYFGVTVSGGNLLEIFRLLNNLSSVLWIENNTGDTSRYDIVYWKKATDLESVFNEITNRLAAGLSIKIDTLKKEKEVNVLSVKKRNENLKTADEIEEGTFKAYTAIGVFVSQLEDKSRQLYMVDPLLQNVFIYNRGMEWKKMNAATADEILMFLKESGVTVTTEKREITLYKINKH